MILFLALGSLVFSTGYFFQEKHEVCREIGFQSAKCDFNYKMELQNSFNNKIEKEPESDTDKLIFFE